MRPKKRSLTIRGHPTSVSLECELWEEFQSIAKSHNLSVASLVAQIDASRGESNHGLSSAIRLFILAYWKDKATHPTSPSTGTVSNNQ